MLLSLFLLLVAHPAAPALHADRVLIEKSARRMTLLDHARVVKRYRISLGTNPIGPKEREGDGRTPEGLYTIDSRNAYSKFHLALHVSYPNAADRARARRLHVRPGGEIMIHGVPNRWRAVGAAIQLTDWTAGCIAVSNKDIEEIWRAVPNGAVVEIRP
jgi:murein L,D-transpeptidase YafK